MFLHQAFCSHCRKLDEIPTATEHACYNVQSNLHAHKTYNMPSTRIPYQISMARPKARARGVLITDRPPVLINYGGDSGVILWGWHLFLILRKLCMSLHLSGTVFLIQNLVLALFCILIQWSIRPTHFFYRPCDCRKTFTHDHIYTRARVRVRVCVCCV